MYDINKNVIEIDASDLLAKLKNVFPKLSEEDLIKRIKKIIKRENELDDLVAKIEIDKTEFILLMYKMYPWMFNKRIYEAIEKYHSIKKRKKKRISKKNARKPTKKSSRARRNI